jgi:hypothetical protein
MESLAKHSLLRQRTEAMVWLMPGRKVETPPHRFMRGLLHHYGIKLQYLNPNGNITAFVTLCEGYLRI